MISKFFKVIIILSLSLSAYAEDSSDQAPGAPASLVNTTAALSSYDVTCTGAVTVGTGSLTFDITSVAAGQAIATFASTTGLPIGTTFTHIKPTLSREIKMRGSVTIAAGSAYTGICSTDSVATAGSGNKYERNLAGKTSGTATLQTFYIGTDSGDAPDRGTSSQNAVSAHPYRIVLLRTVRARLEVEKVVLMVLRINGCPLIPFMELQLKMLPLQIPTLA